jgi:7-keto-8-aminopelargonate synthetase and related enzymes
MGTLGKALGNSGAYIAADSYIIEYLFNKCRTLIYTTALPPASIAGSIEALNIIQQSAVPRENLLSNAQYLRNTLKDIGFNTLDSVSQIIPLVCTSDEESLKLSSFLFDCGIYAPAVRYPTVPAKLPRLRLSLNSNIDKEDINFLVESLKKYKELKGVLK